MVIVLDVVKSKGKWFDISLGVAVLVRCVGSMGDKTIWPFTLKMYIRTPMENNDEV